MRKMLPREENTVKRIYGPRAFVKHKHPDDWPSGIMPPPLLVSRASKSCTTSSISGRLSGFASQHFRITFANALGQQRGMSGRKFCRKKEGMITKNNVYIYLSSAHYMGEKGKSNCTSAVYMEHRANLVNNGR
jgi:hypothetical protein